MIRTNNLVCVGVALIFIAVGLFSLLIASF